MLERAAPVHTYLPLVLLRGVYQCVSVLVFNSANIYDSLTPQIWAVFVTDGLDLDETEWQSGETAHSITGLLTLFV